MNDFTKAFNDPSTVDVTEVPSYTDFVKRVYQAFSFYYDHGNSTYPYSLGGILSQLKDYGEFSLTDLTVFTTGAVLWTVARYILTWSIFAPFSRSLKMDAIETVKMPESMWKFLVYSCLWSLNAYILFGTGQYSDVFYEPVTILRDCQKGMDVGIYVYIMYMAQLSFYVHSVYGTLFMDAWRKDSIVMLGHHFITIMLIGFSYTLRYHKLGVLSLFLHDCTDIVMEFTKCNNYLKKRNGKYYPINDFLSTAGFVCFTASWCLFRLYWFPLKAVYSTCYGSMIFSPMRENTPCVYFLGGMMIMLQCIHIYWFKLILGVLLKALTGREIDDVREADCKSANEKHIGGGDDRVKTGDGEQAKKID